MKNLLNILLFLFAANISFAQEVRDHRPVKNDGKPAQRQPKTTVTTSHEVLLYENSNYDGRFELVKPRTSGTGNYSLANFNDMVSSVQVPVGMVAVLYEHANEKGGFGNYIILMENCPDLSVYNLSDKISYVTVFPAKKTGYNYVRPKNVNGQIIPGHWKRTSVGGQLPDNKGPAIVQYLEAQTTAAQPLVDETLPVFRIQLRIVTGSGENEDTDKEVYVKLNNGDYGYYLDYGPDDFEGGSDKKYDIISNSVRKISDIQFIEIGVQGNDMWGVKKIELYLNNSSAPVFSKTYPAPMRINGTGSYPASVRFSSSELRSLPYWQTIATDASIKKPPIPISADMIKSMVESMVGNQMHHNGQGKLYWGNKEGINTVWGDHLEMKRKDVNTLSFDLDLEAEITGTNPEIDVDFDLVFECTSSGFIHISTANVKSSCDFDFKLIQPSCETIRSVINGALSFLGLDFWKIDDFRTKSNTFNAVFFIGSDGFKCKGVQVTPKGDVFIY